MPPNTLKKEEEGPSVSFLDPSDAVGGSSSMPEGSTRIVPEKEDGSEAEGSSDIGKRRSSSYQRLSTSQSSGMDSSVFRFRDVNFVVGKGDKQKNILTGVCGKVKWGREYFCASETLAFLHAFTYSYFPISVILRCLGSDGAEWRWKSM